MPAYFRVLLLCAMLLTGCDTVSRHKVMSTLFDGYPSLPPADQYCAEYAELRLQEVAQEAAGETAKASKSSRHAPYDEKACRDCHDQEKPDGLRVPARELCFTCHQGFVKGRQVHGPVAVGDCLACHVPHTSANPSLLSAPVDKLCATCHQEARLAGALHVKVADRGLDCIECHDPHFSEVHYFLK